MTNIKKLFFSFAFVIASAQVTAGPTDEDGRIRGFIEKHNAFESMALRISIDKSSHGFVEGKVCDYCEEIKVNITPETKAYNNNVEVPLKQAKGRLGQYATVIYELETKNVSAIRW